MLDMYKQTIWSYYYTLVSFLSSCFLTLGVTHKLIWASWPHVQLGWITFFSFPTSLKEKQTNKIKKIPLAKKKYLCPGEEQNVDNERIHRWCFKIGIHREFTRLFWALNHIFISQKVLRVLSNTALCFVIGLTNYHFPNIFLNLIWCLHSKGRLSECIVVRV